MKLSAVSQTQTARRVPSRWVWAGVVVGAGVGVGMVTGLLPPSLPPSPPPPSNMPAFIAMKDEHERTIYVNTDKIRWVTWDRDCFYVCTNDRGCAVNKAFDDKWKVCKDYKSYSIMKEVVAAESE